MAHAFYSPSKSHQWVNCPGSMAFVENQPSDVRTSNKFADDGTATHEWGGYCMKTGKDPHTMLGATLLINGVTYMLDEERAERIERYIQWAHVMCGGKPQFIEFRVDMRPYIETDGTCDIGHYFPKTGEIFVGDLKDGSGERVYAKYNYQELCYAVGIYNDMLMLGETPTGVRLGICQPKLGVFEVWPPLDEPALPIEELLKFAARAQEAIERAELSMVLGQRELEQFLNPADDKTCRWCGVKVNCTALRTKMTAEIGADFDEVIVGGQMPPPHFPDKLSQAYSALPMIEQWVKAVKGAIWERVKAGEKIEGPDGKAFKFVEGKLGDRKWVDKAKAEATLMQFLTPDKIYEPAEIISAAAANKLLSKKATKATWEVASEDLIKRAPGKPVLVWGSDERPEFTGGATADDFADQLEE